MTLEQDLQKDYPGNRIHLYKLDFTTGLTYVVGPGEDIVTITNENADITFDSVIYSADTSFKFAPAAFRFNEQPEPTFTVHGQWNTLLNVLNFYESLLGTTITRIFTLEHYLDGEAQANPAEKRTEIWKIDQKIKDNKDQVKFKLSPALGLTRKLTDVVLPPISAQSFNK